MGPVTYLRRMRLNEVRRLLQTPRPRNVPKNVTEVARCTVGLVLDQELQRLHGDRHQHAEVVTGVLALQEIPPGEFSSWPGQTEGSAAPGVLVLHAPDNS